MIKARIRWCTCRVENILTLDKLLSLWFCFLLHSILFFISQTSYHTYTIISSYELALPIMGTIFLWQTICFKMGVNFWHTGNTTLALNSGAKALNSAAKSINSGAKSINGGGTKMNEPAT